MKTDLWLKDHPLFVHLAKGNSDHAWAYLAEGMACLIYSVPAFLGITFAKSDAFSRKLIEDIWNDELGKGSVPAHPVLFEEFHGNATNKWGKFQNLHVYGIEAGTKMIKLCGSENWAIGMAAMKAHESQFPSTYGAILKSAKQNLGKDSLFFEVHSVADVEHSSMATKLIETAIQQNICSELKINEAYEKSKLILKNLFDSIWASYENANRNL